MKAKSIWISIFIVVPFLIVFFLSRTSNSRLDLPVSQEIYGENRVCIRTGVSIGSTNEAYLYTLDCQDSSRSDIDLLFPGSKQFGEFKVFDGLVFRNCEEFSLDKINDKYYITTNVDTFCAWLDNAKTHSSRRYEIMFDGKLKEQI